MSRKRGVATALETVSPDALAGLYYIARDLETRG
jgi:hypothetical protein